jgi:hypothetical protein
MLVESPTDGNSKPAPLSRRGLLTFLIPLDDNRPRHPGHQATHVN